MIRAMVVPPCGMGTKHRGPRQALFWLDGVGDRVPGKPCFVPLCRMGVGETWKSAGLSLPMPARFWRTWAPRPYPRHPATSRDIPPPSNFFLLFFAGHGFLSGKTGCWKKSVLSCRQDRKRQRAFVPPGVASVRARTPPRLPARTPALRSENHRQAGVGDPTHRPNTRGRRVGHPSSASGRVCPRADMRCLTLPPVSICKSPTAQSGFR